MIIPHRGQTLKFGTFTENLFYLSFLRYILNSLVHGASAIIFLWKQHNLLLHTPHLKSKATNNHNKTNHLCIVVVDNAPLFLLYYYLHDSSFTLSIRTLFSVFLHPILTNFALHVPELTFGYPRNQSTQPQIPLLSTYKLVIHMGADYLRYPLRIKLKVDRILHA